jgi:hypothetical protein
MAAAERFPLAERCNLPRSGVFEGFYGPARRGRTALLDSPILTGERLIVSGQFVSDSFTSTWIDDCGRDPRRVEASGLALIAMAGDAATLAESFLAWSLEILTCRTIQRPINDAGVGIPCV